MTKYCVTVEETVVSSIYVEANNEAEAKELAEQKFFDGDYDLGDMVDYDFLRVEKHE